MKAIIGKKVGMSQIFDENGHVIPVTVIEAGPCVVTQKKTTEKDGYEAVQLGYEDVLKRSCPSPKSAISTRPAFPPRSTCVSSPSTTAASWSSAPSSRRICSRSAISLT